MVPISFTLPNSAAWNIALHKWLCLCDISVDVFLEVGLLGKKR